MNTVNVIHTSASTHQHSSIIITVHVYECVEYLKEAHHFIPLPDRTHRDQLMCNELISRVKTVKYT